MMRILRYIFSVTSLLLVLPAFSQKQGTEAMRYGGIRIGVDLVPFVGYFLTPPQKGAAFTMDAEFRDGWFAVIHAGYLNFNKEEADYTYHNDGRYLKFGINHNFVPREPGESEIIFWGLGIATGVFTQSADPVVVRNGYWGDYVTSVGPVKMRPFWAEMTAGIRVEMFRNFFMGWNVRGRFLLQLPNKTPEPYIVPGYGYAGKSFSVGFNYTLSFRIPYKIKVIEKKKKETEEEEKK
ncbi:MAG: hypothetical protein J7K46_08715 [Bacteroidales bacterium]|nr:hypothetical protein [Bacteroidales bacterium]